MRIFSGSLATETNTFAPMPTGLASFHDRGYFAAGRHPDQMTLFSGPLWAARLRGKEKDGIWSKAWSPGRNPAVSPRGTAMRRYAMNCLADLKAALPVDVVLLGLHGAMVADRL
jgi:microcystin degradation protein MlrC